MGRFLRRRRFVILLILIAPLVALHVMHAPRNGPFNQDPSYYMQAARHVAAGDGLLTSVSLYHQGLQPLPQPYFDYPLWPLVLGIAAKVAGLITAANVLPQLLFVLDLVLFYLLANRIAGENATFSIRGEQIDVGHVVALLAAANFIFFSSTVVPYTEGLAFALATGSFLLLDDRPLLSGLLAGLSVLARSQMVLVPVATAFVLAVAIIVVSRRYAGALAKYAVASASVNLAWFAYLRAAGVQRAGIVGWQEWIAPASFGGKVIHAAQGLITAVNPASEASLFHSFGPVVLIAPLALFWMFRKRANAATFWAVALSGIGSMIVLATFESVREPFRLFGSRHSAIFLFVLIAAIVALIEAPRVVRALAALLIAASIAHGALTTIRLPLPAGHGLTGAEREMARWLDEQQRGKTVLTTNPQVLSVYTRNRYHWTSCNVDPSQTRHMLAKLTIDFVIVYDAERNCPFARGLGDLLREEAVFSDDVRRIQVFRVMRKISSTGAPSTPHDAAG